MKTVQYEINGFTIKLPIGLEQVLDTPVRDSYQTFLKEDTSLVRRHLTALTTLLPKYLDEPKRVLHVFGGVGATAQVIDQCHPGVIHEFWERDPVLVDYLRRQYPNFDVQQVEDSYATFVRLANLDPYDHIMFDPSVGTIKTRYIKGCWERMGVLQPRMIWLSDTACAKIHLNAKYYAKDFGTDVVPTAEGYLKTYDRYLRYWHNLHIADAMREAAETYCVILPGADGKQFPDPIPYM